MPAVPASLGGTRARKTIQAGPDRLNGPDASINGSHRGGSIWRAS